MVNSIYKLNNYELTNLDKLVIKFISILEKYTPYVIISGYIPILFGNTRPTLDVDVFFKEFNKENILEFLKELRENNFDYIDNDKDFYDIIVSRKEKTDFFDKNSSWYFDFKIAKNKYDNIALNEKDQVIINKKYKLNIAPIELQIPYKVSKLGSDKDIKDATYLFNFFEEKLNYDKLKEFSKLCGADLKIIGVDLNEY